MADDKAVVFIGSSLIDLRAFPETTRRNAGYQIDRVQRGLDPADWKPMNTAGAGARETSIQADSAFRVIYAEKFADAVYVLHAFEKKSQNTPEKAMSFSTGITPHEQKATQYNYDTVSTAAKPARAHS